VKTTAVLLSVFLAPSVFGVERWGMFEFTLQGPASGNRYLDVRLSATFTQGECRVMVPGGIWGMDQCGNSMKARALNDPLICDWCADSPE